MSGTWPQFVRADAVPLVTGVTWLWCVRWSEWGQYWPFRLWCSVTIGYVAVALRVDSQWARPVILLGLGLNVGYLYATRDNRVPRSGAGRERLGHQHRESR